MKNKINIFIIFAILFNIFTNINVYAALITSPSWYDLNGVGIAPDWHYRVPVTVPSTTVSGHTISVDVNFSSLLSSLGVSGSFDINSPRVVRPNGSISTIQEFNQTIYGGATNSISGQGNIRFLAEDSGSNTYYIYFDITQNGTKPINPQTPVGGTFELATTGQSTPPGWASSSVTNASFDAQVRPSETVSVTTDGTVSTGASATVTTDGTSYLGNYSYLLGSRTNNEPASYTGTGATLTKTITVPSSNPGNLVLRYRIEGWDSNVNGNTTQYDYFLAQIVGSSTTNLVSPALNNYSTYPFSPNYGTNQATTTRSGYGQYNSFDMDTNGNHRSGMTFTKGSQQWFTVTQSLASYAGQTITLNLSTYHTFLYKTWVSVDEIEWSMLSGTLGSAQAFGVQINTPITSTNIAAGTTMTITAQVDAMPSTYVTAYVFNASGTQVAGPIRLYNDGTHGSNASTPNLWTNNGTDSSNPTYTIPSTTLASSSWIVRAYGNDGSTSTIGAPNGLVKITTGATTPYNSTNYFDVGDSTFNITGISSFTNVKTVAMLKDPINGTVNPKAIPGADVMYSMVITNNGGGTADANSIVMTDSIPNYTKLYVKDIGSTGSGPILFTDGTPSSGLTYTFTSLSSTTDSVSFSNNGGSTWTYIPVPDANGYDNNVTNIKVVLNGTMNTASGTGTPNFTLQFRVGIL
jgi:hypothetical protein